MDILPKEDFNSIKSNNYILSIDNFEGPLDLLWDLIKKAKIDITEIFIAQVTEQYIEYLKLMEKMNIKVASEFVLMASDLLYYKSKALIPGEEIEDEYFVPPLPPDLVEKLIEYKKIQLTSLKLKEGYENQANIYYRNNTIPDIVDEDVYIGATLYDLLCAFSWVLKNKKEIEHEEIVFDEILVSDRITYIANIIKGKNFILFNELFPNIPSRAELVVTFMAILEMARNGEIRILQHKVFGSIRILRN